MHCLTFAVVLVVLLLLIPRYLEFLQNMKGKHKCQRGMIGWRQIRDDPNHTRYSFNTYENTQF
jgi:hypothetical protein